jgi:hypothetical protein
MAMTPEEWLATQESQPLDPESWMAAQEASQQAANAAKEPSYWERINEPNAPERFNPLESAKRIGTSTAIGGAVGTVIPVVGTGAGALGGFISGTAGEVARTVGTSDLVRFGAEMLGGEIPVVAGPIAKTFKSAVSASNYRSGRVLSIFENDKLERKAIQEVKEKFFGKSEAPIYYTTKNFDDTQVKLQQEFLSPDLVNIGITDPVSTIVRKDLYKTMREGTAIPFVKSTEYKSLVDDLNVLKAQGDEYADDKMIKRLNQKLLLEVNPNARVKETFEQNLLNLIQKKGSYRNAEGETTEVINDKVQDALRKRYNEYLETQVGSQKYNVLKQVEVQEGIAKARDALPTIVNTKFRYGTDEFDTTLNFLNKTPEARNEFIKALNSHFASINDAKVMSSELTRLRPAFLKSRILSEKEMSNIYKKIDEYDPKVDRTMKVDFVKSLLLGPLTAATSSEVYEGKNPLRFFNM